MREDDIKISFMSPFFEAFPCETFPRWGVSIAPLLTEDFISFVSYLIFALDHYKLYI